MPGQVEKGSILFVGGPLNFSWELMLSTPLIYYHTVNGHKWKYRIENLTLGPQAGENSIALTVPIYLLDGFDLNHPVMMAVRSAILRRYGFIE